jgi:2,4-dienoyl-CoA reductase-like NADH-dependent reductase (Old Yellow Enzyme family)
MHSHQRPCRQQYATVGRDADERNNAHGKDCRHQHGDHQPCTTTTAFGGAYASPAAPSAIQASGGTDTDEGIREYVLPRAPKIEEIPGVIEAYRLAKA